MKVYKVVEEITVEGQNYTVMRMTPVTEDEKKWGEHPYIVVHEELKDTKVPLNGGQTLISRTYEELMDRVRFDALIRNFKADHPDADFMEMAKFVASIA